MDWSETIVGWLSGQTCWAYHGDAPLASEPAALTAMALIAHGRDAQAALDWLVQRQGADGSVGITQDQSAPGWPTAEAVLAWALADRHAASDAGRYSVPIDRGVHWLLSSRGMSIERTDPLAHDSSLIGWPWVEGTHSWLEPTAWAVLALKAVGLAQHVRTREAVRLLVDRLLPEGGANYGNTFVLGQQLLPHQESSGVCLLALAGEKINDPRIGLTGDYLERELSRQTATASLSVSLLALAAFNRQPPLAGPLLAAAAERMLIRDRSAYKLALLALAARGTEHPLTTPTEERLP